MNEKKSIILFGLTGQGKSSIANMMIQGDIYHEGNVFEINDGAVGANISIQRSDNDKFIVYDTIRLGEACSGNFSHKEAVKMIREYFTTCQLPLNYIAFVKKKGRFTEEDRKMFNLFKEIFEGNEKNFIIIITNSNPNWVEKNSESLKKNFREDYQIISVDFPFNEDDDAVIQRKKRAQSDESNRSNRATQNLFFKNMTKVVAQIAFKGFARKYT
ncbi:6913_t:CDS:2 [Funneliformis geosporum]|uniref:6913_t:CDS:1 n=1 Tax=Funneliformis geosporum TaxID=1117311 RepID=A0A9W4WXS1_9GLOM|nr:6913_t:CDS:2 [Funneliformis geosporum]